LLLGTGVMLYLMVGPCFSTSSIISSTWFSENLCINLRASVVVSPSWDGEGRASMWICLQTKKRQ
jgi:hypothetical protein